MGKTQKKIGLFNLKTRTQKKSVSFNSNNENIPKKHRSSLENNNNNKSLKSHEYSKLRINSKNNYQDLMGGENGIIPLPDGCNQTSWDKNNNILVPSPEIKGKTIHQHSFFTYNTIIEFKDKFNLMTNKEYKVEAKDPLKIWEYFRGRFYMSNNERDWFYRLNGINETSKMSMDPSISIIMNKIFAPDTTLVIDSTKNLDINSRDIQNVINQYKNVSNSFESKKVLHYDGPIYVKQKGKPQGKIEYSMYKIVSDNNYYPFTVQKKISLTQKARSGYFFDANYDDVNYDDEIISKNMTKNYEKFKCSAMIIDFTEKFIFYFNLHEIPENIPSMIEEIISEAKKTLSFETRNIHYNINNQNDLDKLNNKAETFKTLKKNNIYCLYFMISFLTNKIFVENENKKLFQKEQTDEELINYFKENTINYDFLDNCQKTYFNKAYSSAK